MNEDARLTESGNARSEQLLVMPTEQVTDREWLPGELLSGLECRKPSWFLDMKYQTCFDILHPQRVYLHFDTGNHSSIVSQLPLPGNSNTISGWCKQNCYFSVGQLAEPISCRLASK